jgi:hypothetical protein
MSEPRTPDGKGRVLSTIKPYQQSECLLQTIIVYDVDLVIEPSIVTEQILNLHSVEIAPLILPWKRKGN